MSRLRLEDVESAQLPALSLELQDGECIGLSGPSGMGKSLLLRAIADLDPHQGRIWLDGQEQQAISPTEWRTRVALLEAESAWWAEKVGDHFTNIDPGALQQLGFTSDCLDWSVEHLSSGEKQRLGLLRLLTIRPEVLLLDEPTANLDLDSARKVESLITDYCQQHGASVIWVSHDMEQIKRVTRRHYRLAKDGLFEVTGQ